MKLADINNDGIDELVIVTVNEHGTGINVEEVYIFNKKTLKEIKVSDPLFITNNNVKTKITKSNDNVSISVAIGDNITVIDGKEITNLYNSIFKHKWPNQLYFGNVINFDLVDNKLIATLGTNSILAPSIGDVVIEYKFDGIMLVADKIHFEVYEQYKN